MPNRPSLLVASTGGHLSQLIQLAPRIEPDPEARVWVTFDTPQSRSMLEGQTVEFVTFMAPRQWRAGVSNVPKAVRILRKYSPHQVYSTGSGIALSFLPLARLFGAQACYVESAARIDGPSLTGKALALTPGIRVFSQYQNWARGRWKFGYSVFDEYARQDVETTRPTVDAPRVLVLLGTLGFPFQRLIEQIKSVLPPNAQVVWQLGKTRIPPSGLPGKVIAFAPEADLAAAARDSTIVISHAGCGSAITSLQNGVWPVLVPRRAANGEHIDDHQIQIARELERRGIAVHAEVGDVTPALLRTDFRIDPPHGATP